MIPSGHPEELCEQCGGRNMTWYAPSPIWNKVVRDPAAPLPEILCPQCFTEAYERKFGTPTAWRVTTETEADLPGADRVMSAVWFFLLVLSCVLAGFAIAHAAWLALASFLVSLSVSTYQLAKCCR